MSRLSATIAVLVLAIAAPAHDIWIEPSVCHVAVGEPVELSLMLGNHGNAHRDFKLASKVSPEDKRLSVIDPTGSTLDLTKKLADSDPSPVEGFWRDAFTPDKPGLYLVASRFDKVMSYAPVRDVKSAKSFFIAGPTANQASVAIRGFDRVLGHPFELVPTVDPINVNPLKVRLLYKGKPLTKAKVSFIPRGAELRGKIDPRFERLTDAKGEASLPLMAENVYLIAAHLTDEKAKGNGYESIHYSATLCVLRPGGQP